MGALPSRLKAELDARRAHRQAELGEASIAALTILTRPDGRPWTANTFQKGASQAIRSAGLTGRVWHGLRGTAASWASEEGVNEKGIQALLGHLTAASSQRYARGADQRRLAETAVKAIVLPPSTIG